MDDKGGPLTAVNSSVDTVFDISSKETETRQKVTAETLTRMDDKKNSLDVNSSSDMGQTETDAERLRYEEPDVKDTAEPEAVATADQSSFEEADTAAKLAAAVRTTPTALDSQRARTEVQQQDASVGVGEGQGEENVVSETSLQGVKGRSSQSEHVQLAKAVEASKDGIRREKIGSLPNTLVTQARALFAELTKDGESVLQINEVETLFANMGYTVPRALIEEALQDYDTEFDGGVTESNMILLLEDAETNVKQKKRLLDTFAILDLDGTGLIDGTFLRTLLCGDPPSGEAVFLGGEAPLNEAEFSHFMVEARATPDGLLDYKKFVNDFLFRNPVEPATKPVKQRSKKKKNKVKKV